MAPAQRKSPRKGSLKAAFEVQQKTMPVAVKPAKVPTGKENGLTTPQQISPLKSTTNKKAPTSKTTKAASSAPTFNKKQLQAHTKKFPDTYGSREAPGRLLLANKAHQLSQHTAVNHPGSVFSLNWSPDPDATLLLSSSTYGSIRVWDTSNDEVKQVLELRDTNETDIEEFYCAQFSPDSRYILAAGKLKSRIQWDDDEDDNAIIPSPIKVFDVTTGKVVNKLVGHEEEILCLKTVQYKGNWYALSASQDGYIIRWDLDADFSQYPKEMHKITDPFVDMVFSLAFVPNCGNRYFIAASDQGLKVYDFERCALLKQFPNIYTSYTDCVKFLPVESPQQNGLKKLNDDREFYLVTKGVESLDAEGEKKVSENRCHLLKLSMPTTNNLSDWTMETIREFKHAEYDSNIFTPKLATNGRYLFAGTTSGTTVAWSLATGKATSILRQRGTSVIRDILLAPTRSLLVTASEEGTIQVYKGA